MRPTSPVNNNQSSDAPTRRRGKPVAEVPNSSLDDLSRRLSEVEGVSDDTAIFIARNWKRIITALVVVLLVIWVSNEYRTVSNARMGEASRDFVEHQENFQKIAIDSLIEGKSDSGTVSAFRDKLVVLKNQHQGDIYAKLAEMYIAAASMENKDFEQAREVLDKFRMTNFPMTATSTAKSKQIKPEQLLSELASLLYARMLVVEGKVDPQGMRNHLSGLVYGTSFVTPEAMLLLARTASSEDDKTFVKDVAQKLLAARPELRETIAGELTDLGIVIQ